MNTQLILHIKLTVKKYHAYAEQLFSHGQCVVTLPFGDFQCSITLTILYTGASSLMDGGAANFGAVQYPGRYLDFTLDDELLNFMCAMNNAVPLILHTFHPKGKMLCCIGHTH